MSDLSGLIDAAKVLVVVGGTLVAFAAVLLGLEVISSGSKRIITAVRSGLGDNRSAEYRAYRRSSAYRQKNGAGYARWARRNGEF